jgi:hypothetical protein
MATSPNITPADPVGVIGRVDGDVLIERGADRIPVIGGEHLMPGDKLVSTGGGTAQVQFTSPGAGGKSLQGYLQQGGTVVIPEAAQLAKPQALSLLEADGFDISEAGLDDLPNPLTGEMTRAMMGTVGLGAGVGSAVASAATPVVQSTLNSSQDSLADMPIPGLRLTPAQADAIGDMPSHSPAIEMMSLAALQSLTSMTDTQKPRASSDNPASSSGLPGLKPAELQQGEPFRPDAVASNAAATAAMAAQASGFERVGDIAAAAPAVLGKESTSEQIAQGINEALGLSGSDAQADLDALEAAALLEDLQVSSPLQPNALDVLMGALPAMPAMSAQPDSGDAMSPQSAPDGTDGFGKLMKMIESFESKLNDLTGLVYSAFEGVGPDILVAKSEFSTLPTTNLLSGLSDAVNTVTQVGSSLESGSQTAVADLVSGVGSTVTSGLDATSNTIDSLLGTSTGSVFDNLNTALQDLSGSLDSILNTVGDLTGSGGTGSGSSLSDTLADVTSGLINTGTGLIDSITGGGGSGSGGNVVTDVVDAVTGGGSGSGGNVVTDLLDTVGGVTDTGGSGSSGGSTGGSGGLLGDLSDTLSGEGGLLNPVLPTSGSGDAPTDLSDTPVTVLPGTESSGSDSAVPSTDTSTVVPDVSPDLSDLGAGLSSGLSSAAGALPNEPNNGTGVL